MTTQEWITQFTGELRKESFLMLSNLAKDQSGITIIETGTIRDKSLVDGGSTVILGKLAEDTNGHFYSVDNNSSHIDVAKSVLTEHGTSASFSCVDSVAFLSCFQTPINVLYLDSYDYSEGNPLPAQLHQVAEIGAAYGKLAADALVLLDDCNIPGGGKGLLTGRFLEERGWKLVHDKYQKLFIRS